MTDNIIIFDTTLRDGEQSPGCSMNGDEKLRVAQRLASMNVDVIEAGFPIASKGDFESVQAIANTVKGVQVCGLCRAREQDIDVAWDALKDAENPRIHTFISTSPLHMEYKLKMSPDDVLDKIRMSVSHAYNKCGNVEWSPEDGTRTERDFLCRVVETAIDAGATTINIPDTVGYTVPHEFHDMIAMLMNQVPNIDKAIISVHCHNDLGLAVANSLAAVRAGARQIECTINGIGERAGNAALEEIVMALKTRNDQYYPVDCRVDNTQLVPASRLVSSITGFSVQPNKAIVGANAFAHESGIHQDGMLKHAGTYEIMTPDSVGLDQSNLVLGKHSGRHALKSKLSDLGVTLSDDDFQTYFEQFKLLADQKKDIYDDDLLYLFHDEKGGEDYEFESIEIQCGSGKSASVTLKIVGENPYTTTGNGPVDAMFNAIKSVTGIYDTKLLLYDVRAVTAGTDARAHVSVRLQQADMVVNGHASDFDTLVASAKAYLHCLNRLKKISKRKNPQQGGI